MRREASPLGVLGVSPMNNFVKKLKAICEAVYLKVLASRRPFRDEQITFRFHTLNQQRRLVIIPRIEIARQIEAKEFD